MFRVSGTCQQVRRSTTSARSEPLDLLKVCLMTAGQAVVEQVVAQHEVQVALRPGEFALYDTSRPYRITLHPEWSCLVMTLPRITLGLPDGALRRAMSRAHATDGAGQLLASFLHEAFRAPMATAASSQRVGEAGIALLAGAVADGGVHGNDLDDQDLRHQVVAWVRAHLHEEGLSTAQIARALHLSTRSLQRLFEGEDLGVAGLVRRLRLEAVRRDLDDPLYADRTITSIAARWGITNAAWLSRAFRAQYGVSPSEYRRA